ncbi:acyltransferase [Actinoplanes sp. NPDC048796]|uniref:acyltransferase n=1 Tax=Actinoplanes sp. NPDC048796 TaxID=3155640 RepID=UPI0033E0A123
MTIASISGGRPRAEWADVAKGVCIVLVVLWHVIMKHYLPIDWHLSLPLPGAWGLFGEQLLPLRMPVFFTISGMFAAAAVHRPWRVVRRSRIAKFFYLYAVWFAVHTAVLSLVPRFDTLAAHSLSDVLDQLTITPTNLWYLSALAVYFTVAKLTRRLPVTLVLDAAFALSAVASAGLLAAPGNRGQLYQNLLFFLAGLRLRPWVEQLAARATPRLLVSGVTGYAVVMVAIHVLGARTWFGLWPVTSALAVTVGVLATSLLTRRRGLSSRLAALGRRTLPIYVMHMPLLALIHLMLWRPFSSLGAGPQLVLAAFLPAVLTALLVWLCLLLHRALMSAGASWLFDLPSRSRPRPATPTDWSAAPTRELPRFPR